MISVGELLAWGRDRLRRAAVDAAPREAGLLLARALGRDEAFVLAGEERTVGAAPEARYRDWIGRRTSGEPVAYLLGTREFWGREFEVDDRVLIPRPESEHLIEHALALKLPERPRILDIGTGSGCLAISLALEVPAARLVAVDRSLAALAVARRNAGRLGAHDLLLVAADLATAVELARFDLVVANPPYIEPGEMDSLAPDVREFEPTEALVAPSGGEAMYRRLLTGLASLRPGTPVLVEMAPAQADRLAAWAAEAGFRSVVIHDDLSGRRRIGLLSR